MDTKVNVNRMMYYLFCGMLIGLGAVLPGISGGVMAVIFGIYRPLMDCISNPFKTLKTNWQIIVPVAFGIVLGFLAIAKILSFFLDLYPEQSVCLFVGLIFGMLPSLYREAGEKGRGKKDYISMVVSFAVILAILMVINQVKFEVVPGFGWYLFAGFCMALSLIVPGMSFSTFLMPLGLYTPLVDGIGDFDFSVLIPAGIGGLVTIVLLAKAVTYLMNRFYSVAFHAIIGVVIAATVYIIPYESLTMSVGQSFGCIVCLIVGTVGSLLFAKIDVKKE